MGDLAFVIEGLHKEIQVLKRALSALEMKPALQAGGRSSWTYKQLDELRGARIALRAEIEAAEFRIRILEAQRDRARPLAERRPTDLRPLLAGRVGR